MTRSRRDGMSGAYGRRLIWAVLVVVTAGGCSSGGDDASSVPARDSTDATVPEAELGTGSAGTTVTPTVTPTTTPTTATTPTSPPPIEDGPLAPVCPKRIVVQTEGLPGPDIGPLFELLGPEPVLDVATATVSGPLVRSDGTVEDVTLEIRAGGPAVGFRHPVTLLHGDPDILLAQTSTAEAVRMAPTSPAVGVVALTDRSRDVIIVDPETHPGIETIDAIRESGIEVRHVTNAAFIAYLAGTGALSADQLVPGFDGEPAAFVQSNGAIGQQGDQLVDPVLIPSLPQWGRPVVAVDAASSGWVDSGDALAVRPKAVRAQRDCLGRLVPVIQEAIAAYASAPGATDAVMSGLRAQLTPLTRLTAELMDAGAARGVETGVFPSGDTVGDFDTALLEPFLVEFADIVGVDGAAAENRVTNEFVDASITSAG